MNQCPRILFMNKTIKLLFSKQIIADHWTVSFNVHQVAKANLERRLQETERRLAFRPKSTTASRDELLFRIDQLQSEQTELKKKVEDLEALNSHYLKEKVELSQEKEALEQKLKVMIEYGVSG